ncbi:TetR/AcrR family transcriptional regulator [Actinomadura atramentaria]|uniref:TetR/AcrR family transcriptional regulator n=1 Tax=Actinomadura atramentaria TaxID=1990 RepID=UPI00037455C4|nr:TetR/AcrR family transcriptional regulator [Actinomadura atramentaria]
MTGRPRDPAVDEAIRRAALDLITEQGYRGMSMEGIAARSGVSKQAIYRRYPGKGEVVLDVLAAYARTRLPTPDTGDLREDLLALLEATFAAQRGVPGALNQAIAAEALQDPAFARRMGGELIEARRDAVRQILGRARERGEITHPDDDLLIDLVRGPMWYALMFDPAKLTDAYAAALTDAVIAVAKG